MHHEPSAWMGEVTRCAFRVWDKTQHIARLLRVRKARVLGKKTVDGEVPSKATPRGHVEGIRPQQPGTSFGEEPLPTGIYHMDSGSGKGTGCRSDSRAGDDG